MGQIVNVVERQSSRPGIVRFETNRALSGMGHDRYTAGQVIDDVRPTDELARRIFARGGIAAVHINGSVITVDLEKGYDATGIAEIVRGLYTFYLAPGAELDPADPRAIVAASNEKLQSDWEAAEAAAAVKAAEEAAAVPEGTATEAEGHGEVADDPAEVPNEAEGTVAPADVTE